MLRVNAPGYAPASFRVERDEEAGALILNPAESKTGRVVAGGGTCFRGSLDEQKLAPPNSRFNSFVASMIHGFTIHFAPCCMDRFNDSSILDSRCNVVTL